MQKPPNEAVPGIWKVRAAALPSWCSLFRGSKSETKTRSAFLGLVTVGACRGQGGRALGQAVSSEGLSQEGWDWRACSCFLAWVWENTLEPVPGLGAADIWGQSLSCGVCTVRCSADPWSPLTRHPQCDNQGDLQTLRTSGGHRWKEGTSTWMCLAFCGLLRSGCLGAWG